MRRRTPTPRSLLAAARRLHQTKAPGAARSAACHERPDPLGALDRQELRRTSLVRRQRQRQARGRQCRSRRQRRRDAGDRGRIRLRQEHPCPHPAGPHQADVGRGRLLRSVPRLPSRRPIGRRFARPCSRSSRTRHRRSIRGCGWTRRWRMSCLRHGLATRDTLGARDRRAAGLRRPRRRTSSTTAIRINCPAASSSASRSPGRWRCGPADHRRRAAVEPRHVGPGSGPGPAGQPQGQPQPRLGPDQPRPQCRRCDFRPGDRHVSRQDRRGRPDAAGAGQSGERLHAVPAGGQAGRRSASRPCAPAGHGRRGGFRAKINIQTGPQEHCNERDF